MAICNTIDVIKYFNEKIAKTEKEKPKEEMEKQKKANQLLKKENAKMNEEIHKLKKKLGQQSNKKKELDRKIKDLEVRAQQNMKSLHWLRNARDRIKKEACELQESNMKLKEEVSLSVN